MATRNTSVILTEKIRIEEEKIRKLEARKTNPARQTPYVARPTTTIAVRSTSKPNALWYRVAVSTESLTKILGATASENLEGLGLVHPAAVPEADALRTNKYATFDYPKILIIHGTGTPTRVLTEWGTKWTKKYSKDGKQSHRLLPFGAALSVTTPTFEDVESHFDLQFGPGAGATPTPGPLRAAVGTNGSVSLILGKNSIVKTIKI